MKCAVYPILNVTGWTKDVAVIVDDILANAFASNASQSYIYQGRIFSVQKTIMDTMPDVLTMIDRLERELQDALQTVLDSATVSITHDDEASDSGVDPRIRLTAKISVSDAEGQHSKTGTISATKGQMATWSNYINTGAANIV